MTLRERLLITGLVILGALLVGVGLWQQTRYADAENAIRQYAQLEDRLDVAARERADAKKAGLDTSEVMAELTMLEIDGRIMRNGGKYSVRM